jgi:hypothetical protein
MVNEVMTENLRNLLLSLGAGGNSAYRAGLLARLTKGLPPTYVVKQLGVPREYVKRARAQCKSETGQARFDTLMGARHSAKLEVKRNRSRELDPEVLAFFRSKTIQALQSAGKVTATVILPMSRERLLRDWYIEFPQLIRDFSHRIGDERYFSDGDDGSRPAAVDLKRAAREPVLTRMKANIMASNWMAQQDGFSLDREQRERALIYDLRHNKILTGRRQGGPRQAFEKSAGSRAGMVAFNTISGCAGPAFLDRLPPSETLREITFEPQKWEVKPR